MSKVPIKRLSGNFSLKKFVPSYKIFSMTEGVAGFLSQV